MAAFTTSIDITSGGTYSMDVSNGESSAKVASDLNGKMNNLQTILQAKLPETCTASALPTTLQHGKLIVWNNQLYFGNSSNVPATVTPTTVPSHNHSASNITSGTLSLSRGGTGATSASGACSNIGALPTSGGTITGALTVNGAVHLNNAAIRLGADSSSSLCKINIGDGDYIHLYEYEDDKLEIKGSTINFVTSNLLHNGNALGGNSVKIVTGQTSTTSHSDYTVNVGFKPMVVVYCVDPHVVGIYVRYDSINTVSYIKASSEGWWGNHMTNNGFLALVSKAPTNSTYKIGYVAIG